MVNQDQLIRDANSIPPLPQTAARLVQLMGSDRWSIAEVVSIIRYDPVCTAKVLRLANAAYQAPSRPVADVQTAVVRIGPHAVVSLAVGDAVRDELCQPLPAYGLAADVLWHHSIEAALAVDNLGRFIERRPPPEAFTAALLHDIGKVVLARHLDEEAQRSVQEAQSAGRPAPEKAELDLLAIDHGSVGALVAGRYGLPKAVASAIKHHHRPWEVADLHHRNVAQVVFVADAAANVVSGSQSLEAAIEELQPTMDNLRLKGGSLGELCRLVEAGRDELLEAYS